MKRLYLPMTMLLMATPVVAQDNAATQKLTEQAKQFEQRVVKVADKVHTAVGFSPANVSMIEGDDGLVIVDTGMSIDDGTRIMEEFRKLSDKPVKAIIFTHAHGDHTGGAAAFFGNERPQIWAHKNFGSEARPWKAGGLTFQNVRGARQAGFKLPPDERINNGVAPARYPKRGGAVFSSGKETMPTHFLEGDRKSINVGGVEIELVAAPGETNDELFV
ncbi:MAG: alkyl/aryl-sulfatase, partial [Pirellulaceae bacterium]|nr:alkyl/aryl-sulfatase [Pirellulaceae bacterium]